MDRSYALEFSIEKKKDWWYIGGGGVTKSTVGIQHLMKKKGKKILLSSTLVWKSCDGQEIKKVETLLRQGQV